jgi:hypothetical protein
MIVNRRQPVVVIDGESAGLAGGDLADGAPPALNLEDRLILLRRQHEIGFNVAGMGTGGNLFAAFSSMGRAPRAGAIDHGTFRVGWAVFASTIICHQSCHSRAWGEKYVATVATGGRFSVMTIIIVAAERQSRPVATVATYLFTVVTVSRMGWDSGVDRNPKRPISGSWEVSGLHNDL